MTGARCTAMQMVEPDALAVEVRLLAGEIACEACGGELRPWGHARSRALRDRDARLRLRPRRSRCRDCRITHVLLPTVALRRRIDVAAVIGEALYARHLERRSKSQVATLAGVPPQTLRNWLRRFSERATQIRTHFAALAERLDPSLGPIEPAGTPERDALEAIGAARQAAVRRFGPAPLWCFVSGASGGALASNTNCPLPAPP